MNAQGKVERALSFKFWLTLRRHVSERKFYNRVESHVRGGLSEAEILSNDWWTMDFKNVSKALVIICLPR